MPSSVCVPDSLVSILQQNNSGAELLVESNVYTVVGKFNLGYIIFMYLFVCFF